MFIKFSIALFLYCYVGVKSVAHGAQYELSQLQCGCGHADERTSKIIGGAEVTPYKYPWMVRLYTNGHGFCGGVLITRQYVLTAAHCVVNKTDINVGIAVHDQYRPGRMIASFVAKIRADYRGETAKDVALIKLQEVVTLSERVGILCLPHDASYEQPGRQAIAAGWGITKPENERAQSQYLKEVLMKIVSAGWEISAQGANQTGVCSGDSGSPLFAKYESGKFHVIGVTSSGPKPCMGYSSYARVSLLKQWIVDNIQDSEPCALATDQTAPVETNYL